MGGMLVLGIDGGTATTGYGLLKVVKQVPQVHHWGWIETPKEKEAEERLRLIYNELRRVLLTFQPDIVAVERLFFYNNQKTAIAVAQAQGVMYLAARQRKIPIAAYTPMQVKKIVTGKGNANKKEVKKAIYELFNLKAPKGKKTYFDDVADALGIAFCHLHYTNGVGA